MPVIGNRFANTFTQPPARENPLVQRQRRTPAPRTLPRDFIAANPIARISDPARPSQNQPSNILPTPEVRQPIAPVASNILRPIVERPIAQLPSQLVDPSVGGTVTNYIPVDKYI